MWKSEKKNVIKVKEPKEMKLIENGRRSCKQRKGSNERRRIRVGLNK
jgi:hypothetical protein